MLMIEPDRKDLQVSQKMDSKSIKKKYHSKQANIELIVGRAVSFLK